MNFKKAFIISFTFNILIILFIAGKRYYYSRPINSNDIVFVGNSLTEGFHVTDIYGSGFKNRGIGGNKTYQILHRIGDIARNHPRKIFLEGGINDLNAGCSIDSVFTNFLQIFDSIRILSPQTQLYMQSVFPTCYEYGKLNNLVTILNKKLSEHSSLKGVVYINIHSKMIYNGKLDNSLTEDGIHLNDKGYKIWQQCIEPHLW